MKKDWPLITLTVVQLWTYFFYLIILKRKKNRGLRLAHQKTFIPKEEKRKKECQKKRSLSLLSKTQKKTKR